MENELEIYTQLALGLGLESRRFNKLFKTLDGMGALEPVKDKYVLKKGFSIAVYEQRFKGVLRDLGSDECFKIQAKTLSSGDIVLIKNEKRAKKHTKNKAKSKIKILSVLKKSSLKLCYLEKFKGQIVGVLLETNKRIHLNIKQKSLAQLPRHCVIYVDVFKGEIKEILGVLEDESIDLPVFLLSKGVNEDFSTEAIEFAKSFGREVDSSLYPNRKNLCHLPFCTIDPIDAKDFDDAVYYDAKKRILYVAIADVSEYVSENSILDIEAKARGFSIYFPHKCIPMLPHNLSENLCSLRPGVERLAYVWEICFDSKYNIKQSYLFEGIINSHAALSYDVVDEFLRSKPGSTKKIPKELQASLKGLYKLAINVRARRSNEALMLDVGDVSLELNEDTSIRAIKIKHQNEAQKLIEEAMLLANVQAAKMLDSEMGIYRVHANMDYLKKQQLFSNLGELGFEIKGRDDSQIIKHIQEEASRRGCLDEVNFMLVRAQSKAIYSANVDSHFGLSFKEYTHFTSPIRRYSDLFLHRLLKARMRHKKHANYLANEANALCRYLNIQEKNISYLEMDFCDRKMARYASGCIGLEILAIVIDDASMIASACEKLVGARLFMRDMPEVRLLDRIYVRIVEVNILRSQIFAEFIGWEYPKATKAKSMSKTKKAKNV